MSAYSLVFLIINYAAEMFFILNERLNAQKINKEISEVVLSDIVKHIFAEAFLTELFCPQLLYSFPAVKEIFTWLAQISVVRISPLSMDKLFELMTMGLKYKLFSLRHPSELLEVTWTHLEEIEKIIPPNMRVYLLNFQKTLKELCDRLTMSDLAEIRKELLNLFAGRRTLVSLLLNKGVQSEKGFFNLPQDVFLPPFAACEPPGVIRHYRRGQVVARFTFEHRDSAMRHPFLILNGKWDPTNPLTRVSSNGVNMYSTHNKLSLQKLSSEVVAANVCDLKVETRAVVEGLNRLAQRVACGQRVSGPAFKFSFLDSNCTTDNAEEKEGGGLDFDKSNLISSDMKNYSSIGATGISTDCTLDPLFSGAVGGNVGVPQHNRELIDIMNSLSVCDTQLKLGKDPGGDLLDIMDED